MPALLLEFLADARLDESCCARLGGRAAEAATDLSPAELAACFAVVEGGFLAGMDGEGDELGAATPFVWMPGGAGRFILLAPCCC